jgi:multidrug resistance efflux pump
MDVIVPSKKRRWRVYLGAFGAVAAIAGVTGSVHQMAQAAPAVARSAVWIDRVQRGQFLREVNAPGTLVSDEVRLVTTRATGIVDRVHAKPGAEVDADTLLIELTNPDLEFAALEAATLVKEARAELLDVRANLGIRRIEQRSTLENAKFEYREALRRSKVSQALVEQNAVSRLDAEQQRERREELEQLIEFHEEHAHVLDSGALAQTAAQRARVEGLRAQADLRAAQFAALKVHAGAPGVLAELEAEVGQQVTIGELLGKVINPLKLKAALRVPEAHAKEVAVGQPVTVTIQNDDVTGRVTRIDPGVREGAVRVEVSFANALPGSARLDLSVDGRIEIERVNGALFMGKPASAAAHETIALFKLTPDGRHAARVAVRLGRSSVRSVEVLSGLGEGDRVILSDLSEWDHEGRIQLE